MKGTIVGLVLLFAVLMLSAWANLTAESECRKAGGTYLSRDDLCIRAEVIKPVKTP